MKVATFNANSIRIRLEIILEWLTENDIDVLAIQETKCEDALFPEDAIQDAGYHAAFHGQKSYNGVATLSREPIRNVQMGFGDPTMPEDCRILVADVGPLRILNTYVPNGTKVGSEKWDYKMKWLEAFRGFAAKQFQANPNTVWLGDINVARHPEDVYDSKKVLNGVGHHPDEFKRLDAILEIGLVDLFRKFTAEGGHFTYWEFVVPNSVARNVGWRIDHIYTLPGLADKCTSCTIDKGPRLLERPSDHTFVVAEFDL